MALDKTRLGSALWTKVKATNGAYTPPMSGAADAQGLAFWTGIAEEIINEFKNNATVPTQPGTFKDGSTNAPIVGVGQGTIQ